MVINYRESKRIRRVYARRGCGCPYVTSPARLIQVQSRERHALELLHAFGVSNLADAKILDIGCADGSELRRLVNHGAKPANLFGVDIMAERIDMARELSPNMHFECCDAQQLPFPNGTFDICLIYAVLSSILDDAARYAVASETLRVLKPGGVTLYYDFIWNPRNKDTHGIRFREIKDLFPNCHIITRRATAPPPIIRRLVKFSKRLAIITEALGIIGVFYMCGVHKSTGAGE